VHLPLSKSAVAVTLAVVMSLATSVVAVASGTPASGLTGFDISFPQCSSPLPSAPGFGIVGVNGGAVFTTNKCLASELTWANSAAGGDAGFYANTGNGGPTYGVGWPSSQQTPDACSGANTVACSHDYGWNAARQSFANAVAAENSDGSTNATLSARSAPWWLDVETGNAWETIEYGRNAATQAYDTATLEGEVASFANMGVTSLGIYSTSSMWQVITGATSTAFASIPVWLPGLASTLSAAEAACSATSFTGDRVAMIQYPSQGYDGDYVCGLVSAPVSTSVAVTGSATFSDQLVTTNGAGAVTYVQVGGAPSLVVSPSGLVTTSGQLAPGSYTASGTTSDTSADTGTFSITVDVGELLQSSATTANVKVSGSATYSMQLALTGASGAVTYTQATGAPSLVVGSSGLITTSGSLTAGTYKATGTATDALGDKGTFTFTLKVGALVQRAPTTASITTANSASFSQALSVGANLGTETFVQTTGTPNLLVSSSGVVTTSGTLAAGTYKASGTVSDATGDQGTFTFALTVAKPPPPPPAKPTATVVRGHVVAGRTVTIAIDGTGFNGRPHVSSHRGTSAVVLRDTGTVLIVRVTSAAHSRNGTYTFTITLADGDTCQVRYIQS
jgi:major membrane immunogen (membrane-anchored lipoprotein)